MNRFLLLGILSCAIYATSYAIDNDTTILRPAVVLTNENRQATYETIKAMYEANGLHFQDPRAPRFLFLDRKGRVALGIGGYVKGTMSVDFAGIADNTDFVTATIPSPPQPDMRNQFQMDASTSRIFFKLVGRNTRVGDFSVYLESDFRGVGNGYYGMRLRQAYVQLWRFRAGRAWSAFCDPAAAPPTIDFQGPSGCVLSTNMSIQYTQPLGKHWTSVYAIERLSATYTTHPHYNQSIKQRLPDFPSYTQFEWDGGKSHIRWSNLMRILSYRNLISGKNKFALGFATQLSGVIDAPKNFTFYFQASYGHGFASYLNDLSGYGYDLIPSERNGEMIAPYALGIVGGVQYTFRPGLFCSASYSLCHLYDKPSLPSTAYHYGQYVVANVFYSPFSNCNVGIEYLYGARHNYDNTSGCAHRINTMIQYNF